MRTAPVLRGGPVLTGVWLVGGLFLFACGTICFLESRLGLPPWDVLHQGIAKHTPLSFGVANECRRRRRPHARMVARRQAGIATVANAVLIGGFVALLQPTHAAHVLGDGPLASRVAVMAAGLALTGVGSALYIGAGVGAGPRDSLMLVGARRTGFRVGAVRAAIESTRWSPASPWAARSASGRSSSPR